MALQHSSPSAGDIGDREPPREPDPDRPYEKRIEQERETALSAEEAAEADLGLSELVALMETVDWADVPTFSVAEAAALTARLIEARDAVRGCGQI